MWKMKLSIILIAYFLVAIKAEGERIAGGENALINEYPYATSLMTNGGVGTIYQHACGGTILTSTAILSAASCFYTQGTLNQAVWWRARAGSTFSNSGGVVHLIRLITPHTSFSPTTLDNDLAVLRTSVAIHLQPGVIEAAYLAGAAFSLTVNQPIWAIGWGATSAGNPTFSANLQVVQFFVVNQATCTNRYNGLGFTVTDNMICAGWLDVGVMGQCQGDSGSPLLVDGVVVGVHSWTEGCADGFYPGINTRTGPYTRWIIDTAVATV